MAGYGDWSGPGGSDVAVDGIDVPGGGPDNAMNDGHIVRPWISFSRCTAARRS